MAKLYDTIREWAEGQNLLNEREQDGGSSLSRAASVLLGALRLQGSLADLAVAYHTDDVWWRRISEEFALASDEAAVARKAAHWQRFMEIRHPNTAKRP